MSSVLETLSLKELYTRKKNILFQLNKVDEEIKKRFLENENDIEISLYKANIKEDNLKKIVIKKNIDSIIETSNDNTLQNNNEPQIIRKITLKIKK